MKKQISLVALSAISLGAVSCGNAPAHTVETKSYPVYVGAIDAHQNVKLHFLDGVNDLPYLDADEAGGLIGSFLGTPTMQYSFSLDKKGSVVTITRKNTNASAYDDGAYMKMDFDKDTIEFSDYNLFTLKAGASTLLDLTALPGYNAQGEPQLIQKVETGTFDRYGDVLKLDLKKYNIDLIQQGDQYYIPMQTISDIVLAPSRMKNLFFNGKVLIADSTNAEGNQIYYDAPTGERSKELAEFGYNEFCLMLDTVYGLRDTHEIDSFDNFFQNVAFDAVLKGSSVVDADKAVYRLINDYLDDGHSSWSGFSYLSGQINYKPALGPSETRYINNAKIYRAEREKYYPEGVPGYQEVGDTAYVTFDKFDLLYLADLEYYYTEEDPNKFSDKDTIGLMMKSHYNISKNPNIKNVVLDLSMNSGGAVDTAMFVISWFLGESTLALKDTMTGAMCSTTYKADVNRDRKFDANDTLQGKRLFCLTSPLSFSCGNLVPCIFRESGRVTLLGRTTGGGSCAVGFGSTAWGTSFRMSSQKRMSFLKNGSLYDVDRGVDPDYAISDVENFYKGDQNTPRAVLTEFIDALR